MKNPIEDIGPRFYGSNVKDESHWNGEETFADETGVIWANMDTARKNYEKLLSGAGEYISPDLFANSFKKEHNNNRRLVRRKRSEQVVIFQNRQKNKWRSPEWRFKKR